jgi:RNA polymerase sigma-70 factor (ECF subfamily)
MRGGQTPRSTSAASDASSSQQELTGVRRRDPRALASFFEHHFSRIYNLAFRLMGEKTAAEDVTQEVFLRVYRAAHQIDPRRDPVPWLTTITLNLCRERWRSPSHKLESQTRSLDLQSDLKASLAAKDADPETATIQAERETLLMNAIRKLPSDMRAVVILHDYQGYEHSVIATMVGENAATIRKRYSRALGKLREFLQDVL